MLLKITDKESSIASVHSGSISNIAKLHRVISTIAEEYSWLFSEPKFIDRSGRIEWLTPLEGEAVPYIHADDDLKMVIKFALKEAVETILYDKSEEQIELLKDALEIPTLDNIFYIGGKIVLSEWGHIKSSYNAKRRLIFNLIGGKSSKLIVEVFRDYLPEERCEVELFWKNSRVTVTTDNNGTAIAFLPMGEKVKVRVEDKFEEIVELRHKREKLKIELPPHQPLPSQKELYVEVEENRSVGSSPNQKEPFILEVYDCENGLPIVGEGELIVTVDEKEFRVEIIYGKVEIKDWFDKEIVVDSAVKGYIMKSQSRLLVKASERDKICLEPMMELQKEGGVGDPRFNISWRPSPEDIDIMVITPCGDVIYYEEKEKECEGFKGQLDIDIRESECSKRREDCQENITFDNGGARGEYIIIVKKYFGTLSPTEITLTIINNGEKRVERFTLQNIDDEKRFKIVH
jgi:hypothetical protein